MTLDEKANYVIGTGLDITGANSSLVKKEHFPAYSGRIFQISRLGLPAVLMSDGPAGLNITSKRVWDTPGCIITQLFRLHRLWLQHGILQWFTGLDSW